MSIIYTLSLSSCVQIFTMCTFGSRLHTFFNKLLVLSNCCPIRQIVYRNVLKLFILFCLPGKIYWFVKKFSSLRTCCLYLGMTMCDWSDVKWQCRTALLWNGNAWLVWYKMVMHDWSTLKWQWTQMSWFSVWKVCVHSSVCYIACFVYKSTSWLDV